MLTNNSQVAGAKSFKIGNYGTYLNFVAIDDSNSASNAGVSFTRSGYVGIGTSSPQTKLHVYGAGAIGNAVVAQNSNYSTATTGGAPRPDRTPPTRASACGRERPSR